jgi:FkbM family methyltransferase
MQRFPRVSDAAAGWRFAPELDYLSDSAAWSARSGGREILMSASAGSAKRALIKPVSWYLRHSRVERARWRLELFAVGLSPELRGALTPRVVGTQYGFRMRVDGDSQAGRIIYATGRYEHSTAALFRQIVRPGDVVVDGGAHIGFFTLLASQLAGAAGSVHAFEPSRRNRAILETNVRLNRLTNVVVHPEALGRAADRAVLSYLSERDTGTATVRPVDATAQESVDVVALDAMLPKDRVTLVKLDLEGGEYNALCGMRRLIATHHPAVIVEVTDSFLKSAGGSAVDLYRFLMDQGYRAFLIEHTGLTAVDSEDRWRELPAQFNAFFSVQNTAPVLFE